MIYAQPRISPGEWDAQTPLGFWDTNGSPNLGLTTRFCDTQQKKEDFPVTADHRVKLKESEKRDKYLRLARELKNNGTWKWRWYQLQLVRSIQSLMNWYKDWRTWKYEDKWRPSKLRHCWDRLEYREKWRRLQETNSHSNSGEKPSANTGVKNR